MYRIAVFLFAVEWLVLALLGLSSLAWPVWGAISGEKVWMNPFWPSTLLPIALILAVPLFLAYRRSRVSSLEFDSEFKGRTSLLRLLGMLFIVIGLGVLACFCLLALRLGPVGLKVLAVLALPVLLAGFVASLLALGIGLFLVETRYIFWLKKRRSNKAEQPTLEDARG